MKKILIGLGMTMLCGCITADRFVSAGVDPQIGERHRLYFRTLKVVQVCDDSVHVKHKSDKGLRICIVPLVNDYVTGSYLRRGVYEYVGPYTYETLLDLPGNRRTNTVRLFKEVDENSHKD